MTVITMLVLVTSAVLASGQRPSYAGSRPIGYPEVIKSTTTANPLQDKFGEVTTQRLPIEAQGDRDLVDRLSKLPIDKQPFWFINWQAYEAHRQNPQTYPLQPNQFAEGNLQNSNAPVNTNIGLTFANPTNTGTDIQVQTPNSNSEQSAPNKNTPNNNANVENRFGTTPTSDSNTDNGVKKVGQENSNIYGSTGDTNKPEIPLAPFLLLLADPVVKHEPYQNPNYYRHEY